MLPMNKRTEAITAILTRYYYYWATAVFVVIGFVFWQWLFLPQYNALQTSGVLQHTQLLATIAQREQYLRDLETMQNNFLGLDHRLLRDLPIVLPADYATTTVFSEIEQLFSDTNLSVSSINVSTLGITVAPSDEPIDELTPLEDTTPAGLNDIYEAVSITINVAANRPAGTPADEDVSLSYADFKAVLRRIEQHRHLFNLEQIVYSPTTSSLTLILKTYQQLPAADYEH
jgi:hypothetical protein